MLPVLIARPRDRVSIVNEPGFRAPPGAADGPAHRRGRGRRLTVSHPDLILGMPNSTM